MAIHDIKQNLATDPYTAFTGDINLIGQEWSIKPVGRATSPAVVEIRIFGIHA
jgi:hypothetical protein